MPSLLLSFDNSSVCTDFVVTFNHWRVKLTCFIAAAKKNDHSGFSAGANRIHLIGRILSSVTTSFRNAVKMYVVHTCSSGSQFIIRQASLFAEKQSLFWLKKRLNGDFEGLFSQVCIGLTNIWILNMWTSNYDISVTTYKVEVEDGK